MIWDLPITVEIDGVEHKIRNRCDYRVVLDCITALNDTDLDEINRFQCALFIFYEDLSKITNADVASREMCKIINYGKIEENNNESVVKKMDWELDYPILAPTISGILGYDIRTPDKYTHWWTVVGAFYQVGECAWSTVMSIREKKTKGKKLEEWEREFYRENRRLVDLPHKITDEEQEWLDSDW